MPNAILSDRDRPSEESVDVVDVGDSGEASVVGVANVFVFEVVASQAKSVQPVVILLHQNKVYPSKADPV